MLPHRAALAAALLAGLVALPVAAFPPGHIAYGYEYVAAAPNLDLKDGVGISDPTDPGSACNHRFAGASTYFPQPITDTWTGDQNMGGNLNGPAGSISALAPPLTPTGGFLPNSAGIDLGIACPVPGSGPGTIWLVWSGANWYTAHQESGSALYVCTQLTTTIPCSILANTQTYVVAACGNGNPLQPEWATATFTSDYNDVKGKGLLFAAYPYDILRLKNDAISCPIRHAHDVGSAGYYLFGDDIHAHVVKNDAVVHAGSGTTYVVFCWQSDYLDFSNPLAPVQKTARAHSWKLILDFQDPLGPSNIVAAIQAHYGGAQPGDASVGASPPTRNMRGFHSQSETRAGENGFGPCPLLPLAPPEAKTKPTPLL